MFSYGVLFTSFVFLCDVPVVYDDYSVAYRKAVDIECMLLILFAGDEDDSLGIRFFKNVLCDSSVKNDLSRYVVAKLSLNASVADSDGNRVLLLEHPSFSEMKRLEGLAIIDLDKESSYFGNVVSVFPFVNGNLYTVEQFKVILSLPRGSLTQRTLIYAVRIHPDRPASTDGEKDSILSREAEIHSEYQASIGVQGHHRVNERFDRIRRLMAEVGFAVREIREVCAESWPGQGLLESAIECVRCWRLSSGHWGAVKAFHPKYGYDMRRGKNGVWYATGIFVR